MKIKSKIFLVILMIMILIGNISYAASITTEQLEASINRIFSKNITIVTTADGATTTRTITASNFNLVDSKIQVIEATSGKSIYISYKLENGVCKFETSVDLSEAQGTDVDPTILQALLPVYQATYLELCYLTVANTLGLDLSLADTYYYQKTNGQANIVTDEIFTYEKATNGNISNISLEVNVEKLSQLEKSKIDSASSCEVTVEGGLNEEAPNTQGEPSTPEQPATQEQPSNTQQSTNVGTNTNQQNATQQQQTANNTNNTNNTNKTQSTANLPKAGLETDIIIAIIITGIIMIFFYIKNKENRDIF